MYTLPPLPYALDALEPHISQETLNFHYNKHHKGYVDKLNELVADKPKGNMPLEELILQSTGPIFNNAAQIWNHNFFWQSMSPDATRKPTGKLAQMMDKKWGSLDKFQADFKEQAVANFGSGWTWLVVKNGGLEIVSTSNAHNPVVLGLQALLTIDVWEHAYYLDYKNERPKFVDAFWHVANWDFASKKLEAHH